MGQGEGPRERERERERVGERERDIMKGLDPNSRCSAAAQFQVCVREGGCL